MSWRSNGNAPVARVAHSGMVKSLGYAEAMDASFLVVVLKILGHWRQFKVPETPEYQVFNRWVDAVFTEFHPDMDAWT